MPVDRVVSILDETERSVAVVKDNLDGELGRTSAVLVICGGLMGAWIASIDTGC